VTTWTEGHVHVALRRFLRERHWQLVAGEFPGGSDHELYPLNCVDPTVARDQSPDPRRHSLGELIPDLVALRGDDLFIGEAKVGYSESDRQKLEILVTSRRHDLLRALRKFAEERHFPALLPVERLRLLPALVFTAGSPAPPVPAGFSYVVLESADKARVEGLLASEVAIDAG